MDWFEPSLFLFAAGLLAGFVDSIAGGGGLISLPALLAVGLSPTSALATNKLQSAFGSFTAARNFIRKGYTDLTSSRRLILFTFFGSALGTSLVQRLPSEWLEKGIPFLLFGVGLYFLVQPLITLRKWKGFSLDAPLFMAVGLLLGFYDGFFGPGTGSFWIFALMAFSQLDLLRATAQTKVVNFTSNLAALLMFAMGGNIALTYGLVMACGQIVGARLGSNLAVAWGPKLVRPMLIAVVVLIGYRLIA